jgi:hypothetical protein
MNLVFHIDRHVLLMPECLRVLNEKRNSVTMGIRLGCKNVHLNSGVPLVHGAEGGNAEGKH